MRLPSIHATASERTTRMKFSDLAFRAEARFDNGRGASVVKSPMSYGGNAGLYELAVLDATGKLDYATPITDDVIGWLSEGDVSDLLDRIKALPRC